MCNFPYTPLAWAKPLLILLGCNSWDILKCDLGGIRRGGWREKVKVNGRVIFLPSFLEWVPCSCAPFSPTAALQPAVQVLRPLCRGEQVLRRRGTRANTHARLQLPSGLCVTCAWLSLAADPVGVKTAYPCPSLPWPDLSLAIVRLQNRPGTIHRAIIMLSISMNYG